jgi:hypothetical protein
MESPDRNYPTGFPDSSALGMAVLFPYQICSCFFYGICDTAGQDNHLYFSTEQAET